MGGDGSTRWHGVPTRSTTEEVPALDIALLRPLLDGEVHAAMLACGGRRLPVAARGRALLAFRYPSSVADGADVPEFVDVTWAACGFGGERPWFVCPGCRGGRWRGHPWPA